MPGFHLLHNDSPTNAGGIAIYIAVSITFEYLPDLQINIKGCENIWIKLCQSNIVIETIYRLPQNDAHTFLDTLDQHLDLLKNNKEFLIGDLNINISTSASRSNYAFDYLNVLASHGYFPLITLPTRVTNSSATTLDHIITNDNLHTLKPGAIRADLSDHYPIFCTISNIASKRTSQAVYQHNFANFKPDEFCTDLYDQLSSFLELHDSLHIDNFNHVFNKLIVTITHAINKHAPLVKLTRSQRKLKLKP